MLADAPFRAFRPSGPRTPALANASAAAAGIAISAARRIGKRNLRQVAGVVSWVDSARTCARRATEAVGRETWSSRINQVTSSSLILSSSFASARLSRVEIGRGRDSEQEGGLFAVEVQHDAKRDDFALARGQCSKPFLEGR